MKNKNIYYCYMKSPIGRLKIEEDGKAITALHIRNNGDGDLENTNVVYKLSESELSETCAILCETPLLQNTKKQLNEYFAGNRREFDLPISFQGTDFQKKVWNTLRTIPYGYTLSYGEVAAKIGNPKASRAVGGANNKNPIMIIIPCHRVIGADGSLIGFGGGLPAKEYLLELEKGRVNFSINCK